MYSSCIILPNVSTRPQLGTLDYKPLLHTVSTYEHVPQEAVTMAKTPGSIYLPPCPFRRPKGAKLRPSPRLRDEPLRVLVGNLCPHVCGQVQSA